MPAVQDILWSLTPSRQRNLLGGARGLDLSVQKRSNQQGDDGGLAGDAAYSHGGMLSFVRCDRALPYCFGDASVFG